MAMTDSLKKKFQDFLDRPLGKRLADFGVIYERGGFWAFSVALSVFKEAEGHYHLPVVVYGKTLKNWTRFEIQTPDPWEFASKLKMNLARLRPGPPPTPGDRISAVFGIGLVIRLIHGIRGSKMLVRQSWPDDKGSWVRFHGYLDRKGRRRLLVQKAIDLAGVYEGMLLPGEVADAIIDRLESLDRQ